MADENKIVWGASVLWLLKITPEATLWHISDKQDAEGGMRGSVLTLCLIRMPAFVRKDLTMRELIMTAPICERCMEEFKLAEPVLRARGLLMRDALN